MAADGWVQLGEYIKEERARRHHATQTEFARQLGFRSRTIIGDLEHARRTNYDDFTRETIEIALGWRPGSFERVVNGLKPQRDVDPLMAELRVYWRYLTPASKALVVETARRLRPPTA